MSQKDVDALIDKIYERRVKFPIGKELHHFLNKNLDGFNDLERAADIVNTPLQDVLPKVVFK